jgi:hypothetical protein
MGPYLESVVNVMLDRSPEEWIEGIIVSLFLALALAGAYTVCRRWTKAADDTMPLVVPAIVVIFAGMVLAAGYVHMKLRVPAVTAAGPAENMGPRFDGRPFRGPEGFSTRMTNLIFEAADTDRDGRISTEEAVDAAARFVDEADLNGEGGLDRDALIAALRERLRPPGGAPPPAVAPRPAVAPAPGPRPSS